MLLPAELVASALRRALPLCASAMLVASDGRLLAHAFAAAADGERDEVVAAVAAQAFQEYQTAAAGSLDLPALQFLVLDLEGRRLAAAAVDDRLLVCCVCDPPAGASLAAAGTDIGVAAADAGDAATVAVQGDSRRSGSVKELRAALAAIVAELRGPLALVGRTASVEAALQLPASGATGAVAAGAAGVR